MRRQYTVPGYEGKKLNMTSHPDGVMIGPSVVSSEFVKTGCDKVIAIEKGGLFTRFIEERVHEKFNALIVFLGTISVLLVLSLLAVYAGKLIVKKVDKKVVSKIAGVLFILIGVASFVL